MNIFTPFTTSHSGKLSSLRGLLFIVVMMLATSSAFAQAHFETIDGLRYLIDEDAKYAALVANADEKYSGDIVVPEKVTAKDEKVYPVTSFGDNCFKECKQLKSITIPSSVTSLGDYCFYDCSSLTSVTIPASVTSLEKFCFEDCSGLTRVTIPASVTSLGYYCFSNCSKLESIYFKGKRPSNTKSSLIPTTCIFYVPKEYLQDYKDALGDTYPYIYEWKNSEGGGDKPATKCEMPTITYADGSLQFTTSTTGAEYHYTITDADMANDKLSKDGKVELAAAYKISVYATADGHQPSDKATATLYWVNANLENDPSTNINQAQTRGIVATSDGGIVTLSGLDNGEVVTFFSPDGRRLGAAKAENGTASCAVTGPIVIAKLGGKSIKLIVEY